MNLPPARGATWRELAGLVAALAIVTWIFVFLTDGGVLFTRPLWTDELHTVLLASRATPLGVIADLANGADYGPPLLHLFTWLLRVLTGTLSNTVLRVASLLSVWSALLFVYAILRRRFAVAASVAGTVAVASNSLVVAHSFEARFYGPWLLCAAFFAWTLGIPVSRRRAWLMGTGAALLVMVHWYGVVSLGIMVAALGTVHWREWRATARGLAPASAGFAMFALLVPLAAGQRRALTVNTWVPEFRMAQLEAMTRTYWTALIPMAAVALLLAVLAIAARRRHAVLLERVAESTADDSVVALASLALMPLALAAMSVLGQPSMWPRYGIPAVLAWAPLTALAVGLAGRWPARAFAVLAVGVWFVGFAREALYKRTFAVGVERQLAAIQQARALDAPIVFQSMHAMYAAASGDWSRRMSTSFLELPDSTMDAVMPRGGRFEALNKSLRVERDVARVHNRRFGFPRLAPQRLLDSLPRFVLVASDDNMPPGYSGVEGIVVAVFPHHRLARLAPGLLLLDRTAAAVGR